MKRMNNLTKALLAFSFVAGIIVGMIITYALFYAFIENSIATILGQINVENINFDLNETAIVEAMNKTFGGIN